MKTLVMALTLFVSFSHANASNLNLQDVVLLWDPTEESFYDTVFSEMMGYSNAVSMAASCRSVQVSANQVKCVSNTGRQTLAGTLGRSRGSDNEGDIIYSVNWNANIELRRATLENGVSVWQLAVRNQP